MMAPPTRMKATSTVTLMATMTLLNLANSDTPRRAGRKHGADQESGQVEEIDDGRAIDEHVDPVLLQMMAGRPGQFRGYEQPEVAEQADHIAGPADRDDRGGKAIFEDQQRAHHPGGELADRRIAVGVGGSRNRQRRGQLGIAEAGEGADDSGDGVGDQHGGAGMQRRGIAGPDEDAGADDAADAEEDQVPRPERALELAGAGFFLDLGDALAQPDAPREGLRGAAVAMVNIPLIGIYRWRRSLAALKPRGQFKNRR